VAFKVTEGKRRENKRPMRMLQSHMLFLQPQQHRVLPQRAAKAAALGLYVCNSVAVHHHLKHADFVALQMQ
jgi:hypothetical protein